MKKQKIDKSIMKIPSDVRMMILFAILKHDPFSVYMFSKHSGCARFHVWCEKRFWPKAYTIYSENIKIHKQYLMSYMKNPMFLYFSYYLYVFLKQEIDYSSLYFPCVVLRDKNDKCKFKMDSWYAIQMKWAYKSSLKSQSIFTKLIPPQYKDANFSAPYTVLNSEAVHFFYVFLTHNYWPSPLKYRDKKIQSTLDKWLK
jgi:hypothetical protein